VACGFVEPKIAVSSATDASPAAFASDAAASAPFVPVELRVHPLTAITRSTRAADDEATVHIELLDRWGDTVKALGQLKIEIRVEAPGFGGAGASKSASRSWDIDLGNPEENSRRFDRVTRTYRLRVKGAPRWDPARQRASLIATYTLPSGVVLSDTRDLSTSP